MAKLKKIKVQILSNFNLRYINSFNLKVYILRVGNLTN